MMVGGRENMVIKLSDCIRILSCKASLCCSPGDFKAITDHEHASDQSMTYEINN